MELVIKKATLCQGGTLPGAGVSRETSGARQAGRAQGPRAQGARPPPVHHAISERSTRCRALGRRRRRRLGGLAEHVVRDRPAAVPPVLRRCVATQARKRKGYRELQIGRRFIFFDVSEPQFAARSHGPHGPKNGPDATGPRVMSLIDQEGFMLIYVSK